MFKDIPKLRATAAPDVCSSPKKCEVLQNSTILCQIIFMNYERWHDAHGGRAHFHAGLDRTFDISLPENPIQFDRAMPINFQQY